MPNDIKINQQNIIVLSNELSTEIKDRTNADKDLNQNINTLFQKIDGFDNSNWLKDKKYSFNTNGFPTIYTSNTTKPFIFNSSTLNLNNRTITNLSDGINPSDAVNKNQLDNAISNLSLFNVNGIAINNHVTGEIKYTNDDLGNTYKDQFKNVWTKTTDNIGAAILIADNSNVNMVSNGRITNKMLNQNTSEQVTVQLDPDQLDDYFDELLSSIPKLPTGSLPTNPNPTPIAPPLSLKYKAYGIHRFEYILTKKGVNSIISNQAFDPSDYYTKQEVDNLISGGTVPGTSLNGFNNTNWVSGKEHNFNSSGFPGWSTGNGTDAFINNSTLNVNGRTISNLLEGKNYDDAVTVNQMNEAIKAATRKITPYNSEASNDITAKEINTVIHILSMHKAFNKLGFYLSLKDVKEIFKETYNDLHYLMKNPNEFKILIKDINIDINIDLED